MKIIPSDANITLELQKQKQFHMPVQAVQPTQPSQHTVFTAVTRRPGCCHLVCGTWRG